MKDKVLTVRIPATLDTQVADRARREDISKNQLVRKAVREYLAGETTKPALGAAVKEESA